MFSGLGALPGATSSLAAGVSADGSVVVGTSYSASGTEAFRWTAATGMVGLGTVPGTTSSSAAGISADGSTVTGNSGGTAFRWTAATGMVDIGVFSNLVDEETTVTASGDAISADGSTIAGEYFIDYGPGSNPGGLIQTQGFRWTAAGGTESIPGLTSADSAAAVGVSGDGWTVAGNSSYYDNPDTYEAFRWTESEGTVGLGFLPGSIPGDSYSNAHAISSDGSTIVGDSSDSTGNLRAFRWTAAGGMVGIGTVPGTTGSSAWGVSADGSTIVGALDTTSIPGLAFIWDTTHGMRDLSQVLTAQGADLSGWTLLSAYGVSADGHTIVGWGTNPSGQQEAWIARLPEPGADSLLLTAFLALAIAGRRRNDL